MGNGNGGGNGRYVAQDFIDKIPGSGGIISTIAKRVGCAWHTAKKYCTEYATVAKVYQDECESITDLAESTVLKAIQEGDVSAAKWYLTMKAKDRGYAERKELDIRGLDVDAAIERELARMASSRQGEDAGTAEGGQ